MKWFLAKTDPGTYSIDDLQRDRQTVWDGVTNPQAVKSILSMRTGDLVLIYHSGGQPAIVGVAKVVSAPRPDPGPPKSALIDLKFQKRLDPPTTLAEIKQSGKFDDWLLVRQGRLSTMEVPESFIEWLRQFHPKL